MPIYEYECENCGKIFEVFQKIGDEPIKECKFCGGKVHKVISRPSVFVKGEGAKKEEEGEKKIKPLAERLAEEKLK